MPDLPPEVVTRMEAWQKYGPPGPEHQRLAELAGRWKAKVTSYVAPGVPPMVSLGEAEFRTVLGGRFLEQRYRGDMAGQPFEGFGHFGYDRLRNEYVQTWLDSMSTGMMVLTGSSDASGHVIDFSGTMKDPVTGQEGTIRQVMRIQPGKFDLEMYWPGPDGREFKTMEIVYTKA